MEAQQQPEKQTAKLRNWRVVDGFNGDKILTGNVYDHPKLPDGMFVRTSPLVNEPKDNKAETWNTNYVLLNPVIVDNKNEKT